MEKYFTNLDFPEIAGDFHFKKLPFGGPKLLWGQGAKRKAPSSATKALSQV